MPAPISLRIAPFLLVTKDDEQTASPVNLEPADLAIQTTRVLRLRFRPAR